MSLINSNGDIPIYTNEFSYVEGKFHSIAVTNYNQYGIANPAQSNQVEISKTETTWENNFRGPLCSLFIKDLDGNYTQNRLEVDAWTETNLRVTQVDPSGEQIGYLIIEHDLFAFDVSLE